MKTGGHNANVHKIKKMVSWNKVGRLRIEFGKVIDHYDKASAISS